MPSARAGPCRCRTASPCQCCTRPRRGVGPPRPSSDSSAPSTSSTRSSFFGASLLLSVPAVHYLAELAGQSPDRHRSEPAYRPQLPGRRHTSLNSQGARIVGQLFRSSPAHSAAPILTALILAAAGTMAVADSLQVIYERVFGQPIAAGGTFSDSSPGRASCSASWSPRASSASPLARRAAPWPRDWSPTRGQQLSPGGR